MFSYVIKRAVATLPVMAMVAVVVFAMLRLTPGDPAAILAGDDASGAQLEAIRRSMGLDQPIMVQLYVWMKQLAQGDLGVSLLSGTPVLEMIGGRIGPTLSLAVLTILLTIVVAIPMGVVAARNPGGLLDRTVMTFSVLGFSIPTFVIGYLLIYAMALKLGWFPVQGYSSVDKGLWPFFQRLVLPTLALSGIYIALVARMTRSSVIDVMGEDFIRTARAKGAKETSVLLRHALRNAAVPIVTVIGIGVASLITGVVVTESVFNLPGLGRLVVEAVLARDYPVIQGLILLFSFTYVLINLVVDILYTVFDPRIRY
ncbi:ABC transporter permease [Nitratireductor aquimarinus]|uniref:ABC transporter permease n=1 Tax=Nitratireductor TaxID=245876 RepID=UPI0019D3DA65|nr:MULTISPECIES: ABC transporter permease [Nitratireductor]MBN7778833.1 ABC transporter permease [Nitratireductor pacificus]MBN7783156.1 ABC transporter permease [Nitratireductor pacificus]MBN7791971.1 ABC transporter permease [Nitratireductor aquimarinus]MBY6101221.1 ABC transporter permease [Nitratireductor aquimarinus]MCA1261698.1 ABC transporter permease [Nitratireductor aquimarinus]